MKKNKAIFLDRDGVINEPVIKDGKPYPPNNLNELALIRGVEEGLKLLKDEGFLLFIITNQPDVARGKTQKSAVDEIHTYLKVHLHIDEVFCCFHDDEDNCNCRKPKPGMIEAATEKWNIDLKQSFLVGDRWRDIEVGKSAGVKTILIDYNYLEKKVAADFSTTNFEGVTTYILNKNKS